MTDTGMYVRGQRPEEVQVTDAEERMLKAAQHWLRQQLARLEITVEGSPTSNLLIRDMGRVEDHPALSMQPLPGKGAPGACPVLLSLNADDPVTFATSLADEMAYVYGALLGAGVSAHDALEWLDSRRENGWRSRFTVLESAKRRRLAELLPQARRYSPKRPPEPLQKLSTRAGPRPGIGKK